MLHGLLPELPLTLELLGQLLVLDSVVYLRLHLLNVGCQRSLQAGDLLQDGSRSLQVVCGDQLVGVVDGIALLRLDGINFGSGLGAF